MTNISVPRDLLERIVGKCKLSVLGDDHAKVWELLSAPAVEVEVLDEVGFVVLGGFFHGGSGPELGDIDVVPYMGVLERIQYELVNSSDGVIVPLCSLPKAQAIIDQQAARIKELEKLLVRTRVCLSLDDTEWGHTATEKYTLLADIRASVKGAHDE